MAKEPAQDTELVMDTDPLELIRFKLVRTQKLLLGFAATSILALILAVVLLVMTLSVSNQTQETRATLTDALSDQDLALRRSGIELAAGLESLAQTRIRQGEIEARIAAIDINDHQNVIVRVQRILIRQERDYRDFLIHLQNGLQGMHMMIPHSRGWWDSYSERIQESIALSEARENYILHLREN